MATLVPGLESDFSTVTSTSQLFTVTLAQDQYAVITCDVDCYVRQGANPTAAAADGSILVMAGQSIPINGDSGPKVAIIRKGGADGVATMTRAVLV